MEKSDMTAIPKEIWKELEQRVAYMHGRILQLNARLGSAKAWWKHYEREASRLETELADKERELDCAIDRSTEHEMQQYYLEDQLTEVQEAAEDMVATVDAYDRLLGNVGPSLWNKNEKLKVALSAVSKHRRVLAETILSKEYDDISETIVYKTRWEPPQDVEFHIEVFGAAQERFSMADEIAVIVRTSKFVCCDFCGYVTKQLKMVTDEKKNDVWLCSTCRGQSEGS